MSCHAETSGCWNIGCVCHDANNQCALQFGCSRSRSILTAVETTDVQLFVGEHFISEAGRPFQREKTRAVPGGKSIAG
jgi:hypothetical protein